MTPGAVATPPRPGRLRARVRPRHRAGEAAAFAALYERHQLELYRYCRSIVRHDEDARDAVQSTMTKAFAALQTEGRDIDLRPWLFRIAHNEAISLLRRRPDTAELHEDVGGAQDTLHETVETRDRLALLREDLQDLPERQRAALVMRELSGMGHEEIAAALDTSARAIKQTIYEARSGLNDCAEGRDMECDAVRRVLSDDDRRVVQSRRIRAHLRSCRGCRMFQAALVQRPKDLAALSPVVPLTALGVFSVGGLGGGAAGGGAGAGVAGGAAAGVAAGSGALAVGGGSGLVLAAAAKVAAVVAATATVAGGVIAVADPGPSDGGRSPAARVASEATRTGGPGSGAAAGLRGLEERRATGALAGVGVLDPLAGILTGGSTAFGTTLRAGGANGPDDAGSRGRAARDAAQRRRAAREAARARDAGGAGGGAAGAREDRAADVAGRDADAKGRETADTKRSAAARARGAERRAAATGAAGRSDGTGSAGTRARSGGSGSGSGTKTTGRPPAATPAPQSSSAGGSKRSSRGGSGASGGSGGAAKRTAPKGTGTTGTKRSGGSSASGASAPGSAKASGAKSAAAADGQGQSAGSGAAKAEASAASDD